MQVWEREMGVGIGMGGCRKMKMVVCEMFYSATLRCVQLHAVRSLVASACTCGLQRVQSLTQCFKTSNTIIIS